MWGFFYFKSIIMDLKELTPHQYVVLTIIKGDPNHKHVGPNLQAANYLGSLGLVRPAGQLCFEITEAGRDLYRQKPLFEFELPHTPEVAIRKPIS